jgi:membrane protein YdbS with pleckstrin-like domain
MSDIPTFRSATPLQAPAYVRRGEDVIWIGRPTLALLVSQSLGLLTSFFFLGFFLVGFANNAGRSFTLLPVAAVALFVVLLVLQALRIQRTQYVVTRQSIYTRTGIIGQTVIQTTYDKITDISLKQDVLGRILGFSSLNINTAGSGTPPVRMDGLRDALDMKSLIEAARESYLGGANERASRPTRRFPRFIPDHELVRLVCPTTKKGFRRPRTEIGSAAPCPHCKKTHIVKEPVRGDTARSA